MNYDNQIMLLIEIFVHDIELILLLYLAQLV